MLLAGASLLSPAPAQAAAAPPQQSEAARAAQPKKSRKTGTTVKTVKTSPASKEPTTAAQTELKASAEETKDPVTYYEIGMGHYESKRFKEAVEAFQQSIRLGSTEPKTYFNLGQAYYSLNRYREAREAYKRAVRARPDWAEAHFQLGFMYHILADKNSSQAQYRILQTLNPEMAESFQKLLDTDEKAASAASSDATKSNAINTGATNANASNVTTNGIGTAQASTTPAGAADETQTSSPPAEGTSPSSVAPDSASKQAATSETNPGSTATDTTAGSTASDAAAGTNANNPAASSPIAGTASSPVAATANPSSSGASPSGANPSGASPSGASANPVVVAPAKDEKVAGDAVVAGSVVLAATSVYRVGVGDVLDIRVLNSPTSRSTLFTVMNGGLIEYTLVGGPFPVVGLTTDEIGARLSAELKRRGIGDDSQVVVGVRDYTSHYAIVSGLVNYPGRRILRREAVPLYVVMAEAQLRPDAGRAVIMRAGETIEVNDLADPTALNILVRHEDVIAVSARQLLSYFIGGRINSPGQKGYQSGLTLVQAILAAGGLSRSQETVEISREEPDGRLTTTKYSLKEIKSGKIPDPRLKPGDRIQVGQ